MHCTVQRMHCTVQQLSNALHGAATIECIARCSECIARCSNYRMHCTVQQLSNALHGAATIECIARCSECIARCSAPSVFPDEPVAEQEKPANCRVTMLNSKTRAPITSFERPCSTSSQSLPVSRLLLFELCGRK
jgi:hypothetical protein